MEKKTITGIIALMTFALLGSIILQVYWIRNAVQIKEEQFDENVFAVLRKVAERVELGESESLAKLTDFILRNKSGKKPTEEDLFNAGLDFDQIERFDSLYEVSKGLFLIDTSGEDKLFNLNRRKNVMNTMLYNVLFSYKPLQERIVAEDLTSSLKKELKNAGFEDIKYSSGVFSNQLNAIVIKNGHYTIETKPIDPIRLQAFDFLQNTKYKIDLFSAQDLLSPGSFAIYFPNRAGYVWSSVWMTLLSSVVFTGIILFCFAYTITTILRQKKLGDIKNDFINNMTHEFKTPIATISLATDTILSPSILNNPDKVKRFVDIIKQENKRLNGQVEKVLQAAIVDKSTFQLKMEEINLHDIIDHAMNNFSLQIENREGTLNVDLQAENANIEGDLTHISNIVHNLLDNANKYSPNKPEVSIRTRNISSGIELQVEDKGIGLSTASRKLIFDKFYRVSTGNIHDVKGFGLGLSYVKTMVTAHKGTIEVKSELGKGSTFIVFLPYKVQFG